MSDKISYDSTSVVENWRKDISIGTYLNEKHDVTCAQWLLISKELERGRKQGMRVNSSIRWDQGSIVEV